MERKRQASSAGTRTTRSICMLGECGPHGWVGGGQHLANRDWPTTII